MAAAVVGAVVLVMVSIENGISTTPMFVRTIDAVPTHAGQGISRVESTSSLVSISICVSSTHLEKNKRPDRAHQHMYYRGLP